MPKGALIMMSEKDWRAEDDARTLIEAEKIRNDKTRLKNATAKIRTMKKALENL